MTPSTFSHKVCYYCVYPVCVPLCYGCGFGLTEVPSATVGKITGHYMPDSNMWNLTSGKKKTV